MFFYIYLTIHAVELSSVVLELTSMSSKFQDQEKLITTLLMNNGSSSNASYIQDPDSFKTDASVPRDSIRKNAMIISRFQKVKWSLE